MAKFSKTAKPSLQKLETEGVMRKVSIKEEKIKKEP